MMTETKLKPCPFCGAAAELCYGGSLGYFAECSKLGHLHNVGVLGGTLCKTQQEAAEDWNRRVDDGKIY